MHEWMKWKDGSLFCGFTRSGSKYQKIGRYHTVMPHTPHHNISMAMSVRGYVLVLFWGGADSAWLIRINLLKGHSQSVVYFSNIALLWLYEEATTTGSCKTYTLSSKYFELLCCLHHDTQKRREHLAPHDGNRIEREGINITGTTT